MPKLEVFETDKYGEYLLKNPKEVAQVLNSLIDRRVLVTAYPDRSGPGYVTTILGVNEDEGALYLDHGPDADLNHLTLRADETAFDCVLDRVKVQWLLPHLTMGTFAGKTAFVAALPDALLRLQRRNYFRLAAPAGDLLTCRIPLTSEDGRKITVEARVVDISAGGLGLLIPPEGLMVSAGEIFGESTLHLADGATFPCTLKVRNVFKGTNRNGITMLRCGCEFMGLKANAATQIQRYIMKVERERIARERGL